MKKIIALILSISVLIGVCCFSVSATDDVIAESKMFRLTDLMCWGTAYIYALDENGNELCGEWPGSLMETETNQNGVNTFFYNVPENTNEVIISAAFSKDWQGRLEETEPIYDLDKYDHFWCTGKNENGKYKVMGAVKKPDPQIILPNKPVVRFLDSLNWETAFLYAWDKDGNELLGAFPGTKVEGTFSGFGDIEFVCQIPQNAAGIILSNEKGEKTEDITELSKYDGYVIDGYCDEKGNHKVIGSNSNLPQPVVENKPGDVNGDNVLDVLDAVEIQKNSVEKIQFTDAQKRTGDYNKDGNCDVLDAVEIQKALVAG